MFGLDSPLWQDGFILFLSVVVQATPFLLLGVTLSGLLSVFVDEQQLARFLPGGRWRSSLMGGALGFLFPVCECGNLPVARRLVIKGIPPHVALAFLLSAPVFNPVVMVATWLAFRHMPEMVIYRVGLSFVIAVMMGWIFSFQKDLTPMLNPTVLRDREAQQAAQSGSPQSKLLKGGTFFLPAPSAMSPTATVEPLLAEQVYRSALEEGIPRGAMSWGQRWGLLLDTWVRELRELGSILILGAAVAAVLQTVLPRSLMLDYGQGPLISIVMMMVLAGIISICSTVDAFFALAFAATFTPGSLLAFMVFGPMVDLKALGLMMTLFRPKAIVYILLLTAQFTLLGSLALNLYGL
ncbi:MAG: permease [Synechococcaceae cyanobacterium SM2_3_2]|nr:permease [Synechococcaceae cyanobacterium SM2_3_2]